MNLRLLATLAASATLILGAGSAVAKPTASQDCNLRRVRAAAKYDACQTKAMLKFVTKLDLFALKGASSKCVAKYVAVWPKLQTKFFGTATACDQNRFVVTNDTVVDNLTNLQWERKTDDNSFHDVDNAYAYTFAGDGDSTNADGTAFDTFLWDVNGFCYANNCDWRLPTRAELKTIVNEPFPCTTSPCIAATFGPTISGFYGTSSSAVEDPAGWWVVSFETGDETLFTKTFTIPQRAVRGGF